MTRRFDPFSGAVLLIGAGMLAACNPSGGGAPGAVSEGEAADLEDAAEMLDERQLPDGTLPPTGALPQDASEPEQTEQDTAE